MSFIDILNELLKGKGVSRNKFCADLNIGKNSVANWEQRGNTPDGEVLSKIAAYFSVTVDYLLGRTHHPQVEIIPADPEKVRNHEEKLEQQREESYEKLVEGIKKLLPDVEQPISAEDMEIARRLNSLPPEKRALVLDHLDQLEQNDI